MPVALHEFLIAPLCFALAFRHARRALGGGQALVELLALALYGFGLERAAMSLFSSHDYLSAWRLAPWGVPLAIALVWAALILCALSLAARLGFQGPLARAAAAALVGISLDLLMEPVALRAGLWRWTPAGPFLGVPLGNFVGWGVIVGVYSWGAESSWGHAALTRRLLLRGLLALASIAALLGVGLAWNRLGCERLFSEQGAALVAAALWLATAALPFVAGRTRARANPESLSARLSRGGGREPELVLGLLWLCFATDALLLGRPELWPVVAGALLALASVVRASRVPN